MSATFRVEGLRELDQALSQLKTATARNVLRRVGRAALEPMANTAAALAPERLGLLAFSIAVSEQRTSRAKRGQPRNPHVFEIAMGPASGTGSLYYATHVEFGTVDTPPQPYMRPAWDGQKTGALDIVKSQLAIEIDKAAGRAARRSARRA